MTFILIWVVIAARNRLASECAAQFDWLGLCRVN